MSDRILGCPARFYERKPGVVAFDLDGAVDHGPIHDHEDMPHERDVVVLDGASYVVERVTRRYAKMTRADGGWHHTVVMGLVWIRAFREAGERR